MSKKKDSTIEITVAKGILLPSLMMLLVALLLFVSATYAWFSTRTPYNIDELGIAAGASNNSLTVSADCENWYSDISRADIISGYEGARNVLPSNHIAPVSSSGQIDGDALVFYSGTLTDNGVRAARLSEPTQSSLSGNFYAYDLFFNSNVDATLLLDEGSSVRDTDRSATPISASARVAFVNYGSAEDAETTRALSVPVENEFNAGYKPVGLDEFLDPHKDYYYDSEHGHVLIKNYELTWDLFDGLRRENNLFVLDDSVINSTSVRIWEPNASLHTSSVTATGAIETRAVSAAGLIGDDNTEVIADNVLFNDLFGLGTDKTSVATVKKGYTKIRIYIWIEGQDADAINEASGRSFSVNLKFTLR